MASPNMRSQTPAAQHRKASRFHPYTTTHAMALTVRDMCGQAMGDFHRKETTRVLSNLRRAPSVAPRKQLHDARAAVVLAPGVSALPRSQRIVVPRSAPPRWLAVLALALSVAAATSYALLALYAPAGKA